MKWPHTSAGPVLASVSLAGALWVAPLHRQATAPSADSEPLVLAVSSLPAAESSGGGSPGPVGIDSLEAAWPTARDAIESSDADEASAPSILLDDVDSLRTEEAIRVDGTAEPSPVDEGDVAVPPTP